ncbi:UDP-N-acetylmuramoyl-L-alanyl-D-glutamate--2,6-diaminopimelate ligase [Cyanobacterium stanieri LEGE 03274]|uniref:UDP-N-acetylmuramoyl-L-alanyl-D-glutamate--2,6-diaminopimelate ligase n=1 Tax=Cyanobacterium stanieri LEGE 03274 TaxID=1828756 RepID=A0ABR9V6J4_9CHRO|nr:UDP-N-acetylmuramoyl-L-alanyl-D-glutamate--2,6-diaminopimelate ligase [Cyanobacterium stanieri]MBE9222469.1 UDP-N-acetylmuramoyl-L-alanyl-D-glutamate--2,6-diaminopimelate ligase [Cyanobacterium stanieri LEGE 03274]
MKLRQLLSNIKQINSIPEHPALDTDVKGIVTNSQLVSAGDVFIGMPGTRVDGGEFWQSALNEGAIASIISQEAYDKMPPADSDCVIVADDMNDVCAQIASKFYDYPSQKLGMIGVTGTNGKTTTTHLIEFFLHQAQKKTALFGTLYARWQNYQKTASHTTPFAVDLQAQLTEAVNAGNQYAVMEVSSHALAQKRIKGCHFDVAVFTNLTQDHLDYHKDMEDYFQAKALLFNNEYLHGKAIINYDDPYGQRLIQSSKDVWSYSVTNPEADLYTTDLVYQATGVEGILHTPKGKTKFSSPLVGQFNLSNLLAGVGAVLQLGIDLDTITQGLPHFTGVPGRMERVQVKPNQDITVIVDYAHTPDSLENLLKASRPFITGKMICVFGCGGDRDRTKRPIMGKIAADLADVVVVTSDNPRTENPNQILEDILTGIPNHINPIVQGDRSLAIQTAIQTAQAGDGVLIAGKGHEDYQILGTEKVHFDDREEAQKALNNN